MNKHGLCKQSQVLTNHQVDLFYNVVNECIEETEALLKVHRPTLTIGESSFEFQEICARSKQRFDLRLDTNARIKSLVQDYILSQPCMQQQVQTWLGATEFDFTVSVVYSKPGAVHQGWHADGNHIQDKLYAVCLFIPLIDLNENTGYTQFWPGSHRSNKLIGFGQVAEITGSIWNGMSKKGDGIWYDYRLLHRGMPNLTKDILRPVLQIIFQQTWYVERQNYGTESIVID
jgi:ectoine hydroxylase-related dioxygenase (phytanoyl-CoA dioxygenase family)